VFIVEKLDGHYHIRGVPLEFGNDLVQIPTKLSVKKIDVFSFGYHFLIKPIRDVAKDFVTVLKAPVS